MSIKDKCTSIWSAICHLLNVQNLLSLFGLWPLVVATVASVLIWIWSVLQDLPSPFVAVIALSGFALALVVVNGVMELRKKHPQERSVNADRKQLPSGLEIEFDDDNLSYCEEEPEGAHYPIGRRKTFFVNIRNRNPVKPREHVEVAITKVEPLPQGLRLPIRLPFHGDQSYHATLTAISRRVDVATYFARFYNKEILLSEQKVYAHDTVYIVVLTASGVGSTASRSFLIGLKQDGTFYMYNDSPSKRRELQSIHEETKSIVVSSADDSVRFPSAPPVERDFLVGYSDETQRIEGMKPSQAACPFCGEYAWYLSRSEWVPCGGLDTRQPYTLEMWECKKCGRHQQKTV